MPAQGRSNLHPRNRQTSPCPSAGPAVLPPHHVALGVAVLDLLEAHADGEAVALSEEALHEAGGSEGHHKEWAERHVRWGTPGVAPATHASPLLQAATISHSSAPPCAGPRPGGWCPSLCTGLSSCSAAGQGREGGGREARQGCAQCKTPRRAGQVAESTACKVSSSQLHSRLPPRAHLQELVVV